jgi:hypothetical protein
MVEVSLVYGGVAQVRLGGAAVLSKQRRGLVPTVWLAWWLVAWVTRKRARFSSWVCRVKCVCVARVSDGAGLGWQRNMRSMSCRSVGGAERVHACTTENVVHALGVHGACAA